jgi:hypothetical protein
MRWPDSRCQIEATTVGLLPRGDFLLVPELHPAQFDKEF